jgi:hypothetical protein
MFQHLIVVASRNCAKAVISILEIFSTEFIYVLLYIRPFCIFIFENYLKKVGAKVLKALLEIRFYSYFAISSHQILVIGMNIVLQC